MLTPLITLKEPLNRKSCCLVQTSYDSLQLDYPGYYTNDFAIIGRTIENISITLPHDLTHAQRN